MSFVKCLFTLKKPVKIQIIITPKSSPRPIFHQSTLTEATFFFQLQNLEPHISGISSFPEPYTNGTNTYILV